MSNVFLKHEVSRIFLKKNNVLRVRRGKIRETRVSPVINVEEGGGSTMRKRANNASRDVQNW